MIALKIFLGIAEFIPRSHITFYAKMNSIKYIQVNKAERFKKEKQLK